MLTDWLFLKTKKVSTWKLKNSRCCSTLKRADWTRTARLPSWDASPSTERWRSLVVSCRVRQSYGIHVRADFPTSPKDWRPQACLRQFRCTRPPWTHRPHPWRKAHERIGHHRELRAPPPRPLWRGLRGMAQIVRIKVCDLGHGEPNCRGLN